MTIADIVDKYKIKLYKLMKPLSWTTNINGDENLINIAS